MQGLTPVSGAYSRAPLQDLNEYMELTGFPAAVVTLGRGVRPYAPTDLPLYLL
jgi:hypothetical protein